MFRQVPLVIAVLMGTIAAGVVPPATAWSGGTTDVAPVADGLPDPLTPSSDRIADVAAPNASDTAPPDPDEDVIGWENGYWYNESIDVDQSDGLSEAELERFVARTMARVERIRGLEFRENVTIEFVSREEMRAIARNRTFGSSANDGLWEALFLVGEDRDARDVFAQYHGELVLGFAAEEGAEKVFLVTENPDRPRTDEITLAHELMHVLQHQHFDLYQSKYDPPTLDGEFGKDGVVEGEATLVHKRYQERCNGAWDCVPTPAGWADVGSFSGSGLRLMFYQPYADGAAYVHSLVESGGWEAVNAAHESLPPSSEQVVHLTEEEPAPMSIEDAATGGWQSVDVGESGAERLGEVAIFTLFRSQSRNRDIPELSGAFGSGRDGPYDARNYTSTPSSGWGNDRLLVYRNGDRHGYVWKTVWDTERDAREFFEAYVAVLEANGAARHGESTVVIEDGPFADAFRVTRSGDAVTIVNAPTVDELAEIRPRGIDATATDAAGSTGGTPTSAADGRPTTTGVSVETTETAGDDGAVPGFGALAAALALVIAIAATVARRQVQE
ncbi:MAG: Hvo_1808 family surface protein [Halanaeroarchaeum sp.]